MLQERMKKVSAAAAAIKPLAVDAHQKSGWKNKEGYEVMKSKEN